MKREDVLAIVASSMHAYLVSEGTTPSGPIGDSTPLIGRAAQLDSLGLVGFIVEVEQRFQSEQQLPITIADDRAMSQKNSPFRTVGTLADYIRGLIEEQAGLVRV